jgi:hypothetical protein
MSAVLAPLWIRSYLLMSWISLSSAQPERALRSGLKAQEGNGAEGPVFNRYRGSKRQFVVWDDHPLGRRRLASPSRRVLDVGSVCAQNDVAHFVDELEDGERGFG